MVGGIVNQISEFSLILASLCVKRGIFCEHVLTILAIACVITIVVSGIGHEQLEQGYEKFGKKWFASFDKRAVDLDEAGGGPSNSCFYLTEKCHLDGRVSVKFDREMRGGAARRKSC